MPKLLWNGVDGYDNIESLSRDKELKEVDGVLTRFKGTKKYTAFQVREISAEEAETLENETNTVAFYVDGKHYQSSNP
jgi:hypothetical protein